MLFEKHVDSRVSLGEVQNIRSEDSRSVLRSAKVADQILAVRQVELLLLPQAGFAAGETFGAPHTMRGIQPTFQTIRAPCLFFALRGLVSVDDRHGSTFRSVGLHGVHKIRHVFFTQRARRNMIFKLTTLLSKHYQLVREKLTMGHLQTGPLASTSLATPVPIRCAGSLLSIQATSQTVGTECVVFSRRDGERAHRQVPTDRLTLDMYLIIGRFAVNLKVGWLWYCC